MSDYGVDAEQDMLRALVGISEKKHSKILGEVIAGMDSLKTTLPMTIAALDELLMYALKRSESKDYLSSEDGQDGAFAWVDNYQAIADKSRIDSLDNELWKKLKEGDFSAIWMALPDIIDWENISGFAYTTKQLESPESAPQSLDISQFLLTFRSDATLQTLKNRSVYLISAAGTPPKTYSAYRSIYAEIKINSHLHILNAGNWYEVESSFEDRVKKYFDNFPRASFGKPFMEHQHADEESYNKDIEKNDSSYLTLDRKLIQFGGKHSKIEVCDLYARKVGTAKPKLIHVKRGRASASLSHLFMQGLVSCTLLASESEFVREVNKQIQKTKGFPQFSSAFSGKDYELVYAIVDGLAPVKLDIPFFSKVSFESCCKKIQSYGFDVKLLHIPEDAGYLAGKKAAKARKLNAKKKVAKAKAARQKAVRKSAASHE